MGNQNYGEDRIDSGETSVGKAETVGHNRAPIRTDASIEPIMAKQAKERNLTQYRATALQTLRGCALLRYSVTTLETELTPTSRIMNPGRSLSSRAS